MSTDSSDNECTESPDGFSDDYDSVSDFQDELNTEKFWSKQRDTTGLNFKQTVTLEVAKNL